VYVAAHGMFVCILTLGAISIWVIAVSYRCMFRTYLHSGVERSMTSAGTLFKLSNIDAGTFSRVRLHLGPWVTVINRRTATLTAVCPNMWTQ
jgi:hypothetical protein